MFPGYTICFAVAVAVMAYLVCKIVKMDKTIAEMDKSIVESDKILNDPDFHEHQVFMAFNEAEGWRQKRVAEIYFNASDDDLDHAVRWINYAQPFSEHRSCLSTKDQWKTFFDWSKMWDKMQTLASPNFFWNDSCQNVMLSLHSYHSTGIEGNTLTLSETMVVIENQSLLAEFSADGQVLSPSRSNSVQEVQHIHRVLDELKLSSPPISSGNTVVLFTKRMLVDINSAILGKSSTFRNHAVSVGHQKIVLPMPDEVSHLMDLYIQWVNSRLQSFLSEMELLSGEDILVGSLSLACDAHTKFVHIHPFSDGNGRLARILSGLILHASLLPAPMFLKEARHQYIQAVARNTIEGLSSDLCTLHAEAVERSMDTMISLSNNHCIY